MSINVLDFSICTQPRDKVREQSMLALIKISLEENAALRAEVSSLRSEVSSLRSEVERLTLSFEVCQNGSKGIIKKWKASEVRERRSAERLAVCLEALEKIPKLMEVFKDVEDMELRHYRSAWLRAYSIAKEALSPAPVTETVYGPTGVCPEHGVMKERCKCSQEAGGKTIPQLMSEQYDKENAKSGDRIPDAGEKVEGQLEDDLDLVLGRLRGKHLWIDRAENHRVLEGLVSHVREKALKEAAEIAKPGASHIYNGILALLKKDEGRAG